MKPLQIQLEEEKEEVQAQIPSGILNKSDHSKKEGKDAAGSSSRCSSFLCLSPEDHSGRVKLSFKPGGDVKMVLPSPFKQLQDKLVTEEDEQIDNDPASSIGPLRPLEIHSSRLP